jgi:Uma2 family endonuclease
MLSQERPLKETLLVSNHSLNGKYLFNIDQYYQMIEKGILTENDPIELIKGELVTMSPIGIKHAAFVNRLNRIFHEKLAHQVLVSVQNPIELDEKSAPEPDIILLKPSPDDYEKQKPQIEDILLIIEVSDTTLRYDRTIKIPLYSEAKIMESWIIDLQGESIEVYRYPHTEGYDQMQRYHLGETLSILAFPDISLTVNDIFGK